MLGIYPREPRNKRKAAKFSTHSTTFYYTKDIQYLLHEPLLNKFRDYKALSKKIARSLGRGDVGEAARLEKNGAVKISLDHIIKERYPTFVDALRDLDDALSLLFLFADLPSTSTVPSKTIALCQRLCLEFEHYLITSHSLRKSFLSIKGIYYQAMIQGQNILWLTPYKFVQRVTGDVDFRIMGTFVEFYTTLLGFVNFRLYTGIGLIYPPKFSTRSDELGGELSAYTLEGKGVGQPQPQELSRSQEGGNGTNSADDSTELKQNMQKRIDELGDLNGSLADSDVHEEEPRAEDNNDSIDIFEAIGQGADILPQPQLSDLEAAALFGPFTFFLSRETPRQPLEFILRAFGCKRIGWDVALGDGAWTNNERDLAITHQVVDRPQLPFSSPVLAIPDEDEASLNPATQPLKPGDRVPGRVYVQPQWVWDCINAGKLLRPDLYLPGVILPPHLSPWVKPTKGVYDPSIPLSAQERDGEAEEAAELEAERAEAIEGQDSEKEGDEIAGVHGLRMAEVLSQPISNADDSDDFSQTGMNVANTDDESESESVAEEDSFDGFDDNPISDNPPTVEEIQGSLHQAELEAEAAGLTFAEAHSAATSTSGIKGILKKTGMVGDEARKRGARKKALEDEELKRRMGMMSRKKRKVLEQMMYGKKKGDNEAERLRAKRRRLESRAG